MVTVTEITVIDDYPAYDKGHNPYPTYSVHSEGHEHIIIVNTEMVVDVDVTAETNTVRMYPTAITSAAGFGYSCRTVYWSFTNPILSSRVVVGKDADEWGVWDISYNVSGGKASATWVADWTTTDAIGSGPFQGSQIYLEGGVYYLYYAAGNNGLYKMNLTDGSEIVYDYGWGALEPQSISQKYGTKTAVDYVFFGRHNAGTVITTFDRTDMAIFENLASPGGGSPRAKIGGLYDDGTTKWYPITSGGVATVQNHVNIYDEALTLLGDIDDLTGYWGADNTYNVWGLSILGRIRSTDSVYPSYYLCVGMMQTYYLFFLMDSTFNILLTSIKEIQETGSNAYMYNCHPEYGDWTNKPLVDKVEKKVWVICRYESGGVYENNVYEVDFSEFDVELWNSELYTAEEEDDFDYNVGIRPSVWGA